MNAELKELYEEMIAHLQKGRLLIPAKEDKQMPLLKQKDGRTFLPVFTDAQEFGRFIHMSKGEKFLPVVVEAGKLPGMIQNGISGIVLNPFGVNVPITMTTKK
jgi:hypothetical protein